MSNQPKSSPSKKKKKKSDPFWPIVIILSILAFTGSFWFFYMLTSKINTRTFPTTDTPKLMITPTPDVSLQPGTLMVGDNNSLESAEPSPEASVTDTNTLTGKAPVESSPSAEARSVQSTPAPTPVATASPRPTATPRPAATPRPTTTPAPAAKVSYRVQVGSYSSREAAQSTATQLSEKGYATTLSEDNGRYRIQLGVYESQESALALAEEITQQGYEVVVRKVTL